VRIFCGASKRRRKTKKLGWVQVDVTVQSLRVAGAGIASIRRRRFEAYVVYSDGLLPPAPRSNPRFFYGETSLSWPLLR
jgi:hypothetical protein